MLEPLVRGVWHYHRQMMLKFLTNLLGILVEHMILCFYCPGIFSKAKLLSKTFHMGAMEQLVCLWIG